MANKPKHPGGRPSKYKPEYCKQIIAFFGIPPTKTITETYHYKNGDIKEKEIEVANNLPLIQDFCRKIHVTRDTVLRWTKKYPEFSESYKIARDLQEAIYIHNSLKALYNPTFAIFAGKNMFGWRDKQEISMGVSIEDRLREIWAKKGS